MPFLHVKRRLQSWLLSKNTVLIPKPKRVNSFYSQNSLSLSEPQIDALVASRCLWPTVAKTWCYASFTVIWVHQGAWLGRGGGRLFIYLFLVLFVWFNFYFVRCIFVIKIHRQFFDNLSFELKVWRRHY